MYSPRFIHHSGFQNIDDQANIAYVQERGPLSGFARDISSDDLYYSDFLYRPIYILQTWILFNLFGWDIVRWMIVLLLAHLLAISLLYRLLYRLGGHVRWATLGALVFSAHPFVYSLVFDVVTDSSVIVTVLFLILVQLMMDWEGRLTHYLALFAALFLSVLTRENGMAFSVGVVALALYNDVTRRWDRRQVVLIFLTVGLVIVIYFLMRGYSTTIIPQSRGDYVGEDTVVGFFGTRYEEGQLVALTPFQRLPLYLYTIVIHAVATFFPIFTWWGGFSPGVIIIGAIMLGSLGFVLRQITREQGEQQQTKSSLPNRIMIGVLAIAAGLLLSQVARTQPLDTDEILAILEVLGFALYILVSVLGIYFARKGWRELSASDLRLGLFLCVCMLAGNIVHYSYFRFRNMRYNLIVWLILLTLALYHYLRSNDRVNSLLVTVIQGLMGLMALIPLLQISIFLLRQ